MDLARLYDVIDSDQEDMISFLAHIVSIPAVGPLSGGDGELEKSRFIEGTLKGWDLADIVHFDAPDDLVPSGIRPNMELRFKGNGSGRRIVVLVHMDIVPAGDPSHWTGDPFTLRKVGSKLIGRGVEDNGQALTAALFAVKAIKALGLEPFHDISIVMVSDEEETNKKGIGHLVQQGYFRKDDLILVPDHGDPEGRIIELCEKSLLWVKVNVKGKQCHASMPGLGNNALRASMMFGTEVDRALHERFDRLDPEFDHPVSSFEPTKKGPGVEGINILPGEDSFYLDCRLLPGYGSNEVMDLMRRTADDIQDRLGVKITFEVELQESTKFPTPPDSDIVKMLSSAMSKAAGIVHENGGIGGGTCAALLRNKGYEVAVWETILNRAHTADEYIMIENLISDCKVLSTLFLIDRS